MRRGSADAVQVVDSHVLLGRISRVVWRRGGGAEGIGEEGIGDGTRRTHVAGTRPTSHVSDVNSPRLMEGKLRKRQAELRSAGQCAQDRRGGGDGRGKEREGTGQSSAAQ